MAAQQGCSNRDGPDQSAPALYHLSQPEPLQQTLGGTRVGGQDQRPGGWEVPPTSLQPRLPWHCQTVRGQRQPLPWLTPPQGCWEAELMQVIQAGPKGWRGMVRRMCVGDLPASHTQKEWRGGHFACPNNPLLRLPEAGTRLGTICPEPLP